VKLGLVDDLAAEIFALTVFLCDLLQLSPFHHLLLVAPLQLKMLLLDSL